MHDPIAATTILLIPGSLRAAPVKPPCAPHRRDHALRAEIAPAVAALAARIPDDVRPAA
jgi:hypothetical protein